MILQPIVENAVIHGIACRVLPGEVRIRSRRENAVLRLEVFDNGAGLSEEEKPRNGLGLANTRDRLAQLYGGSQNLRLERRPSGGTIVTLELPFRSQPELEAAGGMV